MERRVRASRARLRAWLPASLWLVVGTAGGDGALAGAPEPIAPDRPGEATPATVVPPGMLQLEGGLEVKRETGDDDDPDTDSYEFPDALLRLGLVRNVELRLESDGLVYQDRGGTRNRATGGDLSAGVKVRFMDQQGVWPSVGAILELSFPTGSRSVTSDGFDPTLQTLFEWSFAERWSLVANLDFAAPTQGVDDRRRIFQLEPEISLGFAITPRWGSHVEYYGALKTGGVADGHLVDGGFSFLVTDDLALDVWAAGGLNEDTPEWVVGVGASWRFRLWEP